MLGGSDMGVSIFKKQRGLQKQIDIQEAFNIWNLLRSRYHSVETIQFFRNFIHDADFCIILNGFHDDWEAAIQRYEGKVKKFKVKAPGRPPREFKTSVEVSIITDDWIFRRIYNDLISQMDCLSSAYRATITDDKLREFIRIDLQNHIHNFEVLYKYGKLKGWMDEPPAYKTPKPQINEDLTVSEAFHIINHLSHRYHQIQITQFFISFAHDKELSLILKQGIKSLQAEVDELEKQAIKYEVPLPKRPPFSVATPSDPETKEDSYLYNTILKGIQDSLDMHARAAIEIVRNDGLRSSFIRLYEKELDLHDKFIKYGKLKGWTMSLPVFTEGC
jgi:hypothetical protein